MHGLKCLRHKIIFWKAFYEAWGLRTIRKRSKLNDILAWEKKEQIYFKDLSHFRGTWKGDFNL